MKEHKLHLALIAFAFCICIGGSIFLYSDWMFKEEFVNKLVLRLLFTVVGITILFGLKITLDYLASKRDYKLIKKLKKYVDNYWEKA